MAWDNFDKEPARLDEQEIDRIIDVAIKELESITKQVSLRADSERLESAIWANALAVSASLTSFSTWSKPADWIRKKLEEWLKKYLPALRAAIKALAKAFGALSYSISVGFPFNISTTITWSLSTP